MISENKESSFMLKCCLSRKKYVSKLKQHGLPDALSKELSFMFVSHDLRAAYYFYCRANYVVLTTDIII